MTRLAANATLVIALVAAVLALLPAFGVEVTKEQTDAILGVIAAALALLGVWFHPSIPIGNTGGAK